MRLQRLTVSTPWSLVLATLPRRWALPVTMRAQVTEAHQRNIDACQKHGNRAGVGGLHSRLDCRHKQANQ